MIWRLVPYVILEGRSRDRIQTSIKKGPQRCGPFCVWWGKSLPGYLPDKSFPQIKHDVPYPNCQTAKIAVHRANRKTHLLA